MDGTRKKPNNLAVNPDERPVKQKTNTVNPVSVKSPNDKGKEFGGGGGQRNEKADLFDGISGHEVAETDGQQAGETEIGAVDVVPALPGAEQDGAAHHEDQHHQQARRHRHRLRILGCVRP